LGSCVLNSALSLLESGLLESFKIFVAFAAHHAALKHEISEYFCGLEEDVESVHRGQGFVGFVLIGKSFGKLLPFLFFLVQLMALLTRLFLNCIIQRFN